MVALAIAAAAIAGPMIGPGCTAVGDAGAAAVSVALADLPPGAAKFFCYRDRTGERIRFVLVRGLDGKVKSVFDACNQCYRFHKGYTVADGYLICRLCGNRYKLEAMQKGLASCVPIAMKTETHSDRIKVAVAELEQGRSLF